jgi:ubiquitin-conjugating enzyme E2 variant
MRRHEMPHRAEDLATGYTRKQHAVNVVCLVAFTALAGYVVYCIARAASGNDAWLLFSASLLGLLGADLLTGIVHWACDSWGRPESWLVGKVFVRSFREHHVDQMAIARHGFVQTNGEQTMAGLPMLAALLLLTPEPGERGTLFVFTALFGVVFWTVAANQIHKWAHQDTPPPKVIVWLQRARFFISHEHHRIHHTMPFTKHYCMTTGWMNEPLDRIGFFRALEWTIHRLTGAIPREDDLGRDVALQVMAGQWPPAPQVAALTAGAATAAPARSRASSADPTADAKRGRTPPVDRA